MGKRGKEEEGGGGEKKKEEKEKKKEVGEKRRRRGNAEKLLPDSMENRGRNRKVMWPDELSRKEEEEICKNFI